MKRSISRIIYNLNESNSNNPADLLVGQDILVKHYNSKGESDDSFLGTLELITNYEVVVRDIHTNKNYSFILNGFNAHENGIEFINDDDENLKFYIY